VDSLSQNSKHSDDPSMGGIHDDGLKGKGSYIGGAGGTSKTKFIKTQAKLPGLPKGGQDNQGMLLPGKNISFPSDTEETVLIFSKLISL